MNNNVVSYSMYAELGYILVNRVEREGHFYALSSAPFLNVVSGEYAKTNTIVGHL